MRLGCIPDSVNHFHNCLHCGVIADGAVAAADIVVNGSGKSNARNSFEGKIARTAERAVAADDNKAVNSSFAANSDSGLHTLVRFEAV